jgi:hypothetical protein
MNALARIELNSGNVRAAEMQVKASLPKSRFDDAYDPKHLESINKLSAANLS